MLLHALRRRPSLTARFRARTSVREFEPSPTRAAGWFHAFPAACAPFFDTAISAKTQRSSGSIPDAHAIRMHP